MTAEIPGGYTLWAKKVFQSPVYKKHPQYFKAFFWLVGNAAFTDGYVFKGRVLKRGQLITTYASFADALAYCFNRAVIKPSLKEIRIMLSWLESEGMITVEPLIDGTLTNKGRPSDLTRAYVGLLITVLNFDTYQDMNLYRGKDKGRPSSELGQLRKRKEKEKKIYTSDSEIPSLEERYSDRDLIIQCFEKISSTRKTNRISDSVKLSILHQWEKYPADQVVAGIRIYLDKDYAAQGKNEKYLLGIIRGNSQQAAANIPGDKVMKKTGSMLDQIYQEQGFTLI